tara:strand:- start:29 stop:637 length:609 start_codon:yes stop_codon:yes gene_type:complete
MSSIKEDLNEIKQSLKEEDLKKANKKIKMKFKWPFGWKQIMNRSKKKMDQILVFYLSIKGNVEKPRLVAIEEGNMVVVKGKPYELDPRAVWTLGKYKCLIIKEIDRRPVSNLDYIEIKRRGDATDSDEFLIKAAMKAVQLGPKKQVAKAGIAIVVVIIIGVMIYLFTQQGAAPVIANAAPQVVHYIPMSAQDIAAQVANGTA